MKRRSLHSRANPVILIFLSVWGFLLLSPVLQAADGKDLYYILNSKPPSISIVNTASLKAIGSIPLESAASHVLMDSGNRFLYVLHNGLFEPEGLLPSGPSSLSIIDLTSNKQIKSIPLGWKVSSMSFSKNGRYLVCFSEGTAGSKKVKRENGTIHLVDTEKNDLTASMNLGKLGAQVLFNDDVSRIFALSRVEPPSKKKGSPPPTKPAVTIFNLGQDKPEAEIEFEFEPKEMALSKDQQWLYVLDRGSPSKNPKKNRNGTVSIVEVASTRLVKTHDVGSWPVGLEVDPNSDSVMLMAQASPKDPTGKLYLLSGSEISDGGLIGEEPQYIRRVGDQPGRMVFSYDEMRFIPDQGSTSSAAILLNDKKGSPPTEANAGFLGGYPGETLYLPGQNKLAMTVLDSLKNPTSKVAIVDMASNKVERVITTGRRSVKIGKFMEASAAVAAMILGGTYTPYNFTDPPPNISLAASPDGKYVYALNTLTNDVTIIDTADGSAAEKIAVGGGARRIQLAPGGKFVCAFSPRQVTLIDVAQKTKASEQKVTSGKVTNVHMDESNRRVLALTTNSILVWDSESGKSLASVGGFSGPTLVLQPR